MIASTGRVAVGIVSLAALGFTLVGCSDDSGSLLADATATVSSEASAAETSASSAAPETSSSSGSSGSTGASGASGAGATSNVDCSGSSCSVTLSGNSEVTVLGATIKLGKIEDGRATFGVGGADVSCSQGETVSAGPLKLACSEVTEDSVSFEASLGS